MMKIFKWKGNFVSWPTNGTPGNYLYFKIRSIFRLSLKKCDKTKSSISSHFVVNKKNLIICIHGGNLGEKYIYMNT